MYKEGAMILSKWIVKYMEEGTYKEKEVQARSGAEAIRKANVKNIKEVTIQRTDEEIMGWIEKLGSNADVSDLLDESFIEYIIGELEITRDIYLKVIAVSKAESDTEYGRCGTCKNYQRLTSCSECEEGSEYEFDYKTYIAEHKITL